MIRSGYSFKTAYGHIAVVHGRVMELGQRAAPLADRNSTFGFVRWNKLCKEANIKPVFGVELAVTAQLGDRKPVVDFWTFIAKEQLRPLHDLIALATSNPGKDPLITYSQALAAVQKGLFAIAGERCRLDAIQPMDGLYIGLSPALNKGLFQKANQRRFAFIAKSDNLFPRAEDKELYRLALGWRSQTQTYSQHILSDKEWWAELYRIAPPKILSEAIANRDWVFQSCSAELKTAKLLVPEKPQTLRAMCEEGAKRLKVNLEDPIYLERLNRELALIAEKDFEDYFYILADIIGWAKQRMVVGPARGSSAGSLVCFLLGITAIDPIPYGLIFERFIDTTRLDLPDVDCDFSDARRDLVLNYAEEKYGKDRVARLGTVGMFKPRSALKQLGAGLKIPHLMVERTLDGVIERSGGDSRALLALEDTLNSTEMGRRLVSEFPSALLAGKMEGHPNNASQHAAGIVMTENPLADYVAIDRRTNSVMCDKKDAEELKLLKIDALGLTQLSIFERCLELLGKPSVTGFFETLPLDDEAAFEVLRKGHFAGVFQFMGGALQSVTKQFRVENLEDIIAVTALARPGPMASGGTHSWLARKTGREQISYPHALFEPYLKNTLGIIIYQETILELCRNIGDLSWQDTTELRKALSRSLGVEFFNRYGDRWKAGAIKKGIPKEVLTKVWDDMCAYGSWSFNRSHAVAYGLISYFCCWLKAHHPIEFAAATLDAEKGPQKQIQLLRELASEGVDYIPVDPEHSDVRWSIKTEGDKKTLVGPLTQIKGIGPASVQEILDARRTGKPIRASLLKRLTSAKTEIDTLFPVRDAIRRLHPDLSQIGIVSTPTVIKDAQCGVQGEIMILAVANRIAPLSENEQQKVAKRNGKVLSGPVQALNLFMRDDTDEIFAKVNRFNYERLGRPIVERGRAGSALYALKGAIWSGFRGLDVTAVRFLGFLDE